jgi:hypothetical protein
MGSAGSTTRTGTGSSSGPEASSEGVVTALTVSGGDHEAGSTAEHKQRVCVVCVWHKPPGAAFHAAAPPPCQAWSMAGKRLGLLDQPLVHQAVADLDWIVPDCLWEIVRPLIPDQRARPQGGRTSPDETLFAAIIYVLVSGCSWRQLPPCFGISPAPSSSTPRTATCCCATTRNGGF